MDFPNNSSGPSPRCAAEFSLTCKIVRSLTRRTSTTPCAWLQPGICTGSLSQFVSETPWRLML